MAAKKKKRGSPGEKITLQHSMKDTQASLLQHTLTIVKEQRLYFLKAAVLSLVIYSFLFGLWKIPFLDFGFTRMSAVTFGDYLFLLAIALFIALFFTLAKYEMQQHLRHDAQKMGKSSSALLGIFAATCPACQGITIAALGSTIFAIPLGFLIPYLGFIKVASLALLGLAVFFKADSLYTKTCPTIIPRRKTKVKKQHPTTEPFLFKNNMLFTLTVILTLFIVFNQFLIPRAFATMMLGGGSGSIGNLEYGSKLTLKPMPLATGEQPAIQGYRSKVKSLPTISELPMQPATGDAVQDLLNNVVPSGTPWYGSEAGVSFDDPITAQKLWVKGEGIQLDAKGEERWNRIVNSFTCDYCCGSPQRPTIITQCGCAHAAAARGMAKWFIQNYGDTYSDEEIYGEMARWYAKWYPQGTIGRIIQESQV